MHTPPPARCITCDRALNVSVPDRNDRERIDSWDLLFCSDECAGVTVAALRLEEHLGVRYDEKGGAFPHLGIFDKVCGGISVQWLVSHPSTMAPFKRAWLTVVRFWGSPLVLRQRFDPTTDRLRTTLHGIELDTSPRAFQHARRCANLLLLQSRRGRTLGSTKMSEDEFRFRAKVAWDWLRTSSEAHGERPRLRDLATELKISKGTLHDYLKRWPLDLSDLADETP